MLLSGVSLGTTLFQALEGLRSQGQGAPSEFQQLGQDLQTGNLTQAQSDYTTLTQYLANSLRTGGGNTPLAQDFTALGQALQAGNLSAARTSYAAIQQIVQQPQSQASQIQSLFQQLGQDLQSGNLSAAQSAYKAIQQDLQQGARQGNLHHHHISGMSSANATSSSSTTQDLSSLGKALRSGSLVAAQTAYSTLQKDLSQFTADATIASGQISLAG